MSATIDTSFDMSATPEGAHSKIIILVDSEDLVECAVISQRINSAIQNVTTHDIPTGGTIPRQKWADDEVQVISGASCVDQAVDLYFTAFPDSNRSVRSVESKFQKLVYYARKMPVVKVQEPEPVPEPEPEPVPEPKKTEKTTAPKKGRSIIPWTREELNVLTHALSSDEAVRLYQAEFGDKRSENGVRQKWIKMQKEKSSPSVSEPTEVPSEKLEIYPDARVRISPTDESSVELEDFDGEEGTVHKISNDNQAFVETVAGKFWIPLRDLLVIS